MIRYKLSAMTMTEPSEVKKRPNQKKRRIKLKRNTGNHSKLPQSLVSHLQHLWLKWFNRNPTKAYSPKNVETPTVELPHLSQPYIVPLTIGMVSFTVVLILAASSLTNPNFISSSTQNLNCQAKINGIWQTNWGNLTFQEQPNSQMVVGKYEYDNLDRGKVTGTLTGNLQNDNLNFTWQENAPRGLQQTGKGTFLFQNTCKELFGTYGTGLSEVGKGSWRGTYLKPAAVSK